MVVLVDDRDGARVQVDPEEVRPHLHAALQLVALLDSSQLAVHSVHIQCTCWQEEFTEGSLLWLTQNLCCRTEIKDGLSQVFSYLSTEAGNWCKNLFQPGSPLSGDKNSCEDKTLNCLRIFAVLCLCLCCRTTYSGKAACFLAWLIKIETLIAETEQTGTENI